MDGRLFLEHIDLFARSRMALVGYYSLMPNLENDLPEVLAAIRARAAGRRLIVPEAAGRCSRSIGFCRTWTYMFPASTKPAIRPAWTIRSRSFRCIALAEQRASSA